jgi:hypothetical protein
MKLLHGTILAAGLIAGTLLAQQETMKMGQQMKDKMAAHMSEMKGKAASKGAAQMDGHREMAQLIEKLSASMSAMEREMDPGALHAKMVEHRKLIEELQAQFLKMHPSEPARQAEPQKNPETHEPEKPADPHAGHH